MRLFIAVNFDPATRDRILAVQERLRELGTGNFSRPENLHLTLAFLGEIDPGRAADICRVMDELTVPELRLEFTNLGCFQRGGADIWWLGLAENKALLSLEKQLTEGLRAAGFAVEDRRFTPHITLARELTTAVPPDKKQLLGGAFTTRAEHISLMLSSRENGRLTYTEQYRAPQD